MMSNSQSVFTRITVAVLAATLLGLAFFSSGATAARKAPAGFFGVAPQTALTRSDTRKMYAGGIRTMRLPLSWGYVQPSKDSFTWDGFDKQVAIAAKEHVSILPFVYGTPGWIDRKPTNLPVSNKHDLTKWRQLLAALVDRYGSKGDFWRLKSSQDIPKTPIRTWQIWNEVNFYYFTTPVDPKAYGKLLNASSSVIKAHDPKAKILLSGLYATPKGPARKAMRADTYIRKLSRYVGKGRFDSMAIHPYSTTTAKLKGTMKNFRKAADSVGYRSKPMLVTELGWGSGYGNGFLLGSQRAQAKQLRSAFTYLVGARHQLKLRGAYWFSWKDARKNVETCSFCYSVGLFGAQSHLKPKKVWSTFKAFSYRP